MSSILQKKNTGSETTVNVFIFLFLIAILILIIVIFMQIRSVVSNEMETIEEQEDQEYYEEN
jgi:uncharacterized protein YpmS